jgi:hypothetical protein
MTLPFQLNRRHKAALFLTLLGTGASLVSGAGFQQAAGIMILGAAFAWAFGSDSRFIHSLFAVLGFALLVGPLAYDWYSYRATSKKYRERVADFERKIPELATSYPEHFVIVENSHSRFGTRRVGAPIANADELDGFLKNYPVYTSAGRQAVLEKLRHRATANGIVTLRLSTDKERTEDQTYLLLDVLVLPDFWESRPQWYADARAASIDLAAVPADQKPGNPPRPFRLWEAVKQSWIFEVPGVMLVTMSLGLFCGIKGARKQ